MKPDKLAQSIIAALHAMDAQVGTAESLTGGLVAAHLTSIPGASRVVRGGVVAYSIEVKDRVLGVSGDLLKQVGAVDARVAEEMALGARALLNADYAVATTGSAGPEPAPGGALPAIEPGEVFIAVSGPDSCVVERVQLTGSRGQIREDAVLWALTLLEGIVTRDALSEA